MKHNWEYRVFSDVFDLQMGKTPDRKNPSLFEGDNVWVTISDMLGVEVSESKEHISDIAASSIKKVKKGTVIMSFKLSVGKTAIAGQDLYTNEAIMAFNLKDGFEIDNKFLFYYLSGYKWQGGNRAVLGVTLNKATLSKHVMSIPPLSTQTAIVSELDALSAIIADHKSLLKKYDELEQSIFYDMFGDPVKNEKGWEVKFLKEICTVQSGLVSPLEPPYCDMFHVGPANMISNSNELIDLKKAKDENLISGKYLFEPGMVLYSKIRPNLNKVLVANFRGICSADMYPLICNHLSIPIYLVTILRQKRFIQYATENSGRANIPKINRETLINYDTILPPLPLQQEFASKIEAIEAMKADTKKSLAKSEELFNARMDYYFNA